MEEALVKRLSSQKVEFDVMAKPDRYRALKEYAAVFPYLLAVWLTVCVGFLLLYALGIPSKWPYPITPLSFLGAAAVTTPISSIVLRRRLRLAALHRATSASP